MISYAQVEFLDLVPCRCGILLHSHYDYAPMDALSIEKRAAELQRSAEENFGRVKVLLRRGSTLRRGGIASK